jgi:D-alanine transfer protein
MKKLISFLIPVLIAIISVIAINDFLDKQIVDLVEQKNPSLIGRNYGDLTKDRSVIIKNILSNKDDLFLMGSSEMGVSVPQNSINFFPFNGADYNVSCFGRAYTQNLQQATVLGGTDLKENQRIALIVSIQWFESSHGMDAGDFVVNFSDIQFYNFLKNPKVSEENKIYYAKRVYQLLTGANKYYPEAIYARLYYSENPLKNVIKLAFEPYYKVNEYLSNIKDKALIYKKLKELPDKQSDTTLKTVNWKEEYDKVEKENSEIPSTNKFHLTDEYYNNRLAGVEDTLKGMDKNIDLVNSKEMDDYKFLLSVCKDLNMEPYIILPPVNGWYDDYLGLEKDRRDAYYNTVKGLASNSGLDVLDLSKYDYEKDFLVDVMHLGKEGWLKVSEEIYKHFDK